jgi:hypothetical protein
MRDCGDGHAGAALVDARQDIPEADLLSCGEACGQLQDGALAGAAGYATVLESVDWPVAFRRLDRPWRRACSPADPPDTS